MISLQRNARIDFLRGMAISCVLVLHFALSYGLKDSPLGALLDQDLLKAMVYNGNYGVTVFFVISGFLITSHSLTRWGSLSNLDVRAFYAARARRILPGLLLALAIIVTLGCAGVPDFSSANDVKTLPSSHFILSVGSVLTFWHNHLMQSEGYFNYCLNVYWSLSVEEMFYLLLPLVCMLLRGRAIWLLCAAAVIAGPYYRSIHADNEIFYMYGYLACFDAIAIGCVTAALARRLQGGLRYRRVLRALAGVGMAAVYLQGIGGHETFGFTWMALGAAVFLLAAAGDTSNGVSACRLTAPLRWMGKHSYELYLFHVIVLALMRNAVTKADLTFATRLPWFAVYIMLSALLAWGVTRLFQNAPWRIVAPATSPQPELKA